MASWPAMIILRMKAFINNEKAVAFRSRLIPAYAGGVSNSYQNFMPLNLTPGPMVVESTRLLM